MTAFGFVWDAYFPRSEHQSLLRIQHSLTALEYKIRNKTKGSENHAKEAHHRIMTGEEGFTLLYANLVGAKEALSAMDPTAPLEEEKAFLARVHWVHQDLKLEQTAINNAE